MTQTQDQASKEDGGQASLEERLKVLEAELQSEKDNRKKAEEKQGAELRKKQAELDREKASRLLNPKPAAPPARIPPGAMPPQVNPVQQRLQEIDNAAKEAAKEALLYKELVRRGLTEEDVEGIDFDTPAELKTALDMIEIRKENEKLRKEVEASKVVPKKEEEEEDLNVDTGGQTSPRAPDSQAQRVATLREEAKKAGRTELGRWRLLEAIYQDPSKIVVSHRQVSNDNE